MKRFNTFLITIFIGFSSATLANTVQTFKQQLAKYQGQIVYLDFWASWCSPCRQSFPWLNQMQSKYKAQGFTVFSVNLDTEQAFASAFLEDVPAHFPIFYDPNGKIAKQFKVRGMPSSYLIDSAGNVVKAHVGFNSKKQDKYEQEIKALINKRTNNSNTKSIQ